MQDDNTNTAPAVAGEPLLTPAEEVRICQWEKEQLFVYYQSAPNALRTLSWSLLQEPITAQNRPALLAFMLAMDLLENEKAMQEASALEPDFPDQAQVIASFWRGHVGMGDSRQLALMTTESEREAITAAALGLVALRPSPVPSAEATKTRAAAPVPVQTVKGNGKP